MAACAYLFNQKPQTQNECKTDKNAENEEKT